MFGLQFEEQAGVVPGDPNRADIACFVGFAALRPGVRVPAEIEQWLVAQGWGLNRPVDLNAEAAAPDALPEIVNLPASTPPLDVTIDGRGQLIPLPNGPLTRTGLVAYVNERLSGGYARLELFDRARARYRLVFGTGSRGPRSSIALKALAELGITADVNASGSTRQAPLEELLDLPVPIDSWEVFDRLFEWDSRPVAGTAQTASTYLGSGVRSFFAQGGRKCYVVRLGSPAAANEARPLRSLQVSRMLPGYPNWLSASPSDRDSWSGVTHLFGLPDVSMLCLPDLPEILAADIPPMTPVEELPPPPEQFVECSDQVPFPVDGHLRGVPEPRCDEAAYGEWAGVVCLIGNLLSRWCREAQILAAVPLPDKEGPAAADLFAFLNDRGRGPLATKLFEGPGGIASAFVQLVYPWVRSAAASRLPGLLEPPDGLLAGIIAQTALTRSSFSSAAGSSPLEVSDLYPLLSQYQMLSPPPSGQAEKAAASFVERVSLLGFVPGGVALLSDVTTSIDEAYRSAGISRLVAAIVRAARIVGEDIMFESSGEPVWARIRSGLNSLMLGLLQEGALVGAAAEEAFSVRCDRSTMSQNDIDNGRVVCRIEFTGAASIERITVVLALEEGGQVSLLSTGNPAGEAA
jgi:hypothetical protein